MNKRLFYTKEDAIKKVEEIQSRQEFNVNDESIFCNFCNYGIVELYSMPTSKCVWYICNRCNGTGFEISLK